MPTKLQPEDAEQRNQTPGTVNDSIKDTLVNTAAWFLPAVGFTYACGFLIVFTFVKNYGVNTIEFIEAKYIHIGCLFVMACITIILPMRWIFIAIQRWLNDKDNKAQVNNTLQTLFRGGHFCKTVWEDVVKRFYWADWHMRGEHGLHATFPAIGSGIFMLWSFLLLLTFAQPDFTLVHPRLVFFNLLLPLAIISLAIPADRLGDWMKANGQHDFYYPNAHTFWKRGNCSLRIFWTLAGPACLFWFFRSRTSFDHFLRVSIPAFFLPPVCVIAVVWWRLFFWRERSEAADSRKLQQRLTVTRWVLYPIQWTLFLGQCCIFLQGNPPRQCRHKLT